MGKRIDCQTRNNIVTQVRVFGKEPKRVCVELGVSDATVYTTLKTFDFVKARDWKGLEYFATHSGKCFGMNVIRWAIDSANATPPELWIYQLEKKMKESRYEEAKAKAYETKPTKEEPKPEPPKPIAPEQTPTGTKVFIPAPTAEVGWQTRMKVFPDKVCLTVYFNGREVVSGWSKVRGDKELDLMQSISYAAHMCYKIVEQRKLMGVKK